MKLQIGINKENMVGYTLIDPTKGGNYYNFNDICDMAECTELYANDMMDYIHHSELTILLKYWISKLRHGGKIVLGGTDVLKAAESLACGRISIADFNKKVFGMVNNAWDNKSGMYSASELSALLKEHGLKISLKRIVEDVFVVEAIRD